MEGTGKEAAPTPRERVLVTGATGYIGGRLVPRLLSRGYRVRCLTRSREKLAARAWAAEAGVEIATGDVGDPAVEGALRGCTAAYYLVHSMLAAGEEFAEHDRRLARRFAAAAERAGCARILYLGGLGETGTELSPHLASRREVERELSSTSVSLTVLRAAIILGAGSASFEILRYLVERLPIMVTPRWVDTECQPIAVIDVLHYLVASLETEATIGRTLDIGGPEIVSYRELMQATARALGLRRRLIVPVPVLTPRLSSLWIHLVTPLSHRIARPLAEGLRNRVVCRDDEAARLMPHPRQTIRRALEAAVAHQLRGEVETSWRDAGPVPGDPDWAGGKVFVDRRRVAVAARPATVYRSVCRIGGGNGWYAADLLWRLRGALDRVLGGPGLRRGRRDPEEIGFGDALDFWRVTGIERGRWLRLRAEMKLPGEATLEFEIRTAPDDPGCELRQTARYQPRGLAGLLYWYAVLPFHHLVFGGMLAGIRRHAEKRESVASGSRSPG